MARLPPRFLALSPGELLAGSEQEFVVRARMALGNGLPGLILREPALADRDFLALARELGKHCNDSGAWFCVHDRVHVALEVSANAVHLGFRSLPADAARTLLPAHVALGISTHDGDEPALFERCDYRIHGPVFDTPSKRGIRTPIGMTGLARAVNSSKVPLIAIGGLQPEDFAEVLERGAHGVCARAALFHSGDSLEDTARRTKHWMAVMAGSPA